jgi:hypothetical protein
MCVTHVSRSNSAPFPFIYQGESGFYSAQATRGSRGALFLRWSTGQWIVRSRTSCCWRNQLHGSAWGEQISHRLRCWKVWSGVIEPQLTERNLDINGYQPARTFHVGRVIGSDRIRFDSRRHADYSKHHVALRWFGKKPIGCRVLFASCRGEGETIARRNCQMD